MGAYCGIAKQRKSKKYKRTEDLCQLGDYAVELQWLYTDGYFALAIQNSLLSS